MEKVMTQVPAFVWEAFSRAQAISDRKAVCNATWSADEAGDAILDMIDRGVVPGCPKTFHRQFRNLLVNRSGKYRRRSAIKAAHYDPLHANDCSPSMFEAIAARSALRQLQGRAKAADWSLLVRVGMGARLAEIAMSLGSTETAVKKRLARARERIAA
jgi:hypothetical protein